MLRSSGFSVRRSRLPFQFLFILVLAAFLSSCGGSSNFARASSAVSGTLSAGTGATDRTAVANAVGAPAISAVVAAPITSATATIVWTTDVAADSQVEYGTTTAYGSSSVLNSTQVTFHSVTVTGLAATTTYHYRVHSGTSVSGDFTFTTVPFSISAVRPSSVTACSATIAWSTTDLANSLVDYGATTSYGATTVLDPTLVTSHVGVIPGLAALTTYHYRVHSGASVSGDFTFTTLSPTISNVTASN